jgi:hypothetical protein
VAFETAAADFEDKPGVEEDLCRASLDRRWSRPPPHLPRLEMEQISVTAAATGVETGMGDVHYKKFVD